MSQVQIGTSGWSYAHWREVFYPPGLPQRRWLEHYCGEFSTVEVNATFYRLPAEATFAGWRSRTPDGFLFALKAPRIITHLKKLADCEEDVDRFLSRAKLLADRLGPLLFQFPPNRACDPPLFAAFLSQLPCQPRFAFEFREAGWLCDSVYALLREHNAALVRVSAPRYPEAEVTTADFQYLRMHGEKHLYASKYSDESLARWADSIAGWADEGQDVFVYFNNDAQGYAVENARALREMVKERC
ncbi:MAG: DUF72 domain-containing protein [Armatimonadota bacterium]|nr:MAG: DUF72 domain-containing protein [Armatimonadota bacterium]